MPKTNAELLALLDLEARATQGPWERPTGYDDETGEEFETLELKGPTYTQNYCGQDIPGVRDTVCIAGFGPHKQHVPNLQFIAAARNNIRPLIEEVLALRKALAEIAANQGGPHAE